MTNQTAQPTGVPADAKVLPSGEREFALDVRTQDMEVNFGPQHPATHGVMRIPNYVGRLTGGGVDPRCRPTLATDAGSALVVDGGNAMGQIACSFALDRVLDRATETGVAFAAVGNSNHCGALAWYASRAIERDLVLVVGTNGSVEGSYGKTHLGAERPEYTGASCELPQDLTGTCVP